MSEQSERVEVDGTSRVFQDSLLNKLVGKWHVTGTVVGRPLEHLCDADWVLNHQFLRVHFIDVTPERTEEDRRRVKYEALVFMGYDNMSERYVIHWMDTFGGRFSETLGYATREADTDQPSTSIRFLFEYPNGPLRNTFTWNEHDGTWSDLIRQKDEKGNWTTFIEEVFHRRTG